MLMLLYFYSGKLTCKRMHFSKHQVKTSWALHTLTGWTNISVCEKKTTKNSPSGHVRQESCWNTSPALYSAWTHSSTSWAVNKRQGSRSCRVCRWNNEWTDRASVTEWVDHQYLHYLFSYSSVIGQERKESNSTYSSCQMSNFYGYFL